MQGITLTANIRYPFDKHCNISKNICCIHSISFQAVQNETITFFFCFLYDYIFVYNKSTELCSVLNDVTKIGRNTQY